MIMDVAGPSFSPNDEQSMEETPNEETQAFYNLLAASQSPLFEGCSSHSEFSALLELLTIKAEHNLCQEAYNKIVNEPGPLIIVCRQIIIEQRRWLKDYV
jgi:hypothetical protein